MHTLYLVATPIGNMEDVTLRALRVLGEVDLIAAEDTRTTQKLLRAHNISTKVTSYFEGNKEVKTPQIIKRLEFQDVAIVSEAGMPALSDPGYELIAAAIDRGIRVVPVPGASAITTALVVSGLPTDQFLFLGFLPRKAHHRRNFLGKIQSSPHTLVVFEAPHRLRKSLHDILAILGDRPLAVGREMTKVFEEIFRGTVSESIEYFQVCRGEFTLIISGAQPETETRPPNLVEDRLLELRADGISPTKAVTQIAREIGIRRAEVYETWIHLD
jgi:16S rRNA (cytidine1402-2'-O)-methyltransferase